MIPPPYDRDGSLPTRGETAGGGRPGKDRLGGIPVAVIRLPKGSPLPRVDPEGGQDRRVLESDDVVLSLPPYPPGRNRNRRCRVRSLESGLPYTGERSGSCWNRCAVRHRWNRSSRIHVIGEGVSAMADSVGRAGHLRDQIDGYRYHPVFSMRGRPRTGKGCVELARGRVREGRAVREAVRSVAIETRAGSAAAASRICGVGRDLHAPGWDRGEPPI